MPDTGTQPAITIQGLKKQFGAVLALAGVDLTVDAGELFGFLGPNGAGKTTTIRVLTGFLKPTSGHARVFGMDAWSESIAIRRRLGFLPDNTGLYEALTGEEVLDYLGSLSQSVSRATRRDLCSRLELSEAALRRKVKGYSRGMRQKLAIVQALQHEPELLVMDEPTEGLDPLMQQSLFSILRDAQRAGRTVFFSSHKIPEVEQLCNRVAIIRQGALIAVSDIQQLRREKVRRMDVVFSGPAPEKMDVPGVDVLERDGARWSLAVRGELNMLIRELARYDIADMVFEPAHLEDIFLEFYRGTSKQS